MHGTPDQQSPTGYLNVQRTAGRRQESVSGQCHCVHAWDLQVRVVCAGPNSLDHAYHRDRLAFSVLVRRFFMKMLTYIFILF